MPKRVKVTANVETTVLIESRRRCCLCVFLDGDWSEKQIQIAHIDRDPSNSSSNNLAALCLRHHDLYDSRHSQSKGYTPGELRAYRDRLSQVLQRWSDAPSTIINSPPVRHALLGAQDEGLERSRPPARGVQVIDDPGSILQRREGERPGNELLRLARQGWLDPRIDAVGEIAVTMVGEAPADRSRRLVVIGNATSTVWQIALFERNTGTWVSTFNIIEETNGSAPAVRVVPGDLTSAVVIKRVTMRGTGVLCRSSFWYTASSNGAALILEYPTFAYVSGWCGFQRKIGSEVTDYPARLTQGADLTLRYRVDYEADPLTDIEAPLFSLERTVVLEWDDEAKLFVPSSSSTASAVEAAEWFDDDDGRFLERHLEQLRTIAEAGTSEQREWLRRFLLRCQEMPSTSTLRQLLQSGS